MAAHAFKCPQRLISCPHPDCNTTHPGTAVLMHIAFDHPEIVNHASVGAIAQLMLESPEGISGEVTCPKGRYVLLHVLTHHEKEVDSTCIKQAINVLLKLNDTPSQSSSGRPAEFTDPRLPIQNLDSSVVCRLGKTGKFYCGKAMWFSTDCTCCEGNCGTISGSNCKSCMQLDLAARRLPKGYLLLGHFYCGRRMPELVKNSECDGSCGPSNGPNCLACQCLDRCSTHAYRTLL
ncbi:hypothetical protein BDR26DRAFT_864138 [Obelidium mucronatum]|nr:hypothetical protein BDR26DRAFT_864138 [Obelidium mucronatum]